MRWRQQLERLPGRPAAWASHREVLRYRMRKYGLTPSKPAKLEDSDVATGTRESPADTPAAEVSPDSAAETKLFAVGVLKRSDSLSPVIISMTIAISRSTSAPPFFLVAPSFLGDRSQVLGDIEKAVRDALEVRRELAEGLRVDDHAERRRDSPPGVGDGARPRRRRTTRATLARRIDGADVGSPFQSRRITCRTRRGSKPRDSQTFSKEKGACASTAPHPPPGGQSGERLLAVVGRSARQRIASSRTAARRASCGRGAR